MAKKFIIISFLLSAWTIMLNAQEIKTDTIRTELQSEFIKAVGDSTDLVIAGSGSSNWFISLSGGINSLAAEANRRYDNFLGRSRMTFRLGIGKWFTPIWGFRAQMGVGKLSGHSRLQTYYYYNIYDQGIDHTVMPDEMKPYLSEKYGEYWLHRKFTYMDWSINVITDAVRWFTKEPQKVGLILSAGPGFSHAFGSQGLSPNNSFSFNAGLQLNVNVHENWDIFAEFQGTIVDETFDGQIGGENHQRNRAVEGYGGLSLGITYKFGGKKFKRYAKVNPITYEQIRYTPAPKVYNTVVHYNEDITDFTVRFFIDKYTIEEDQKLNIDKVARYLIRHPQANVQLTGYADKETAYPEYNMKLSQRRVNNVRDYLVNDCGISPSRITTEAKGDTQRAYDEDFRWNRAVVMKIIDNNLKNK